MSVPAQKEQKCHFPLTNDYGFSEIKKKTFMTRENWLDEVAADVDVYQIMTLPIREMFSGTPARQGL